VVVQLTDIKINHSSSMPENSGVQGKLGVYISPDISGVQGTEKVKTEMDRF